MGAFEAIKKIVAEQTHEHSSGMRMEAFEAKAGCLLAEHSAFYLRAVYGVKV